MIELEGISRSFGNRDILSGISLTIPEGEIFALIGHSGSGKTTLLRILDLLERPSSGRILYRGAVVGDREEDRLAVRRRMGMVFQKPVPLSSSVFENVAAGLRFRDADAATIRERVGKALEVVGIPSLAGRRAATLSGGEMQRVALARAIATGPEVLILDEPTANLDPANTALIEDLVVSINKRFRTTIVMATHDLTQGQRLADRIAVLSHGRLLQTGAPEEIFYRPASPEVARFVGVENNLPGEVTGSEDGLALVDLGGVRVTGVATLPAGTRVTACIRGEDIILFSSGETRSSARNLLTGRIRRIASDGPFSRVIVDAGVPLTALITTKSVGALALAPGLEISLGFKAGDVHLIQGTRT
ncbi:MAG: ABC transporter ATP-binding protein [Methanomicrobiales archaeon]|nr:ABC transporter ATP-binding protein [Methanomicrobiales archaeon]